MVVKAGVLLICALVAFMAAAEPEPNAVFGVLSDVHLVPADKQSVAKFTEDDVLAGKLVTPGMSLQNVIFSEKGATKGR